MAYTLKEWKFYFDSGDVSNLLRSKEVKFWSKPSNQGQIGQISRNIPNIHMVRLQILPRIQIKNSLRSNQVIRRSNLGQNRQIRVKSGQVDGIYPTCICFDSKYCQEFEFTIIRGQNRPNRGQTRVKNVKLGSNVAK